MDEAGLIPDHQFGFRRRHQKKSALALKYGFWRPSSRVASLRWNLVKRALIIKELAPAIQCLHGRTDCAAEPWETLQPSWCKAGPPRRLTEKDNYSGQQRPVNGFHIFSPTPQSLKMPYNGITLDRRLTWKPHILKKINQANQPLKKYYWLIGRRSKLPTSSKVPIYKAIRPIWTYGIQL